MSFLGPEDSRIAAFRRLQMTLSSAPSVALLQATGLLGLDRALGGGLPQGSLVAVYGPVTSGRYALAAHLLARATHQAFAGLCDDGSWYPPALAQAGVNLDRLLVVLGNEPRALLRSADLLVRGGGLSLVVLPPVRARSAMWRRLRQLAQQHATVVVALAAAPLDDALALAADVHLRCHLERALWSAVPAPLTQLLGYDLRVDVLRARHVRGHPSAQISAVA